MKPKLAWPLAALAAILVGAAIPLLYYPTFYFADDTQAGAFGQWYKIGDRILEGDWSFVNPTVWQSGNYLAEGAWGIFSPVLWGVGLASHVLPDIVVFSTIVKWTCMLLAGLGVYLLSREFSASRPWAAVVAVAAPLAGFTLYMDAPSWVNGLMAWSLLPLTWWLVRRAAVRGASVLPAVLAAVAMIGIGYVHGTLFLAVVLIATLIEGALVHGRGAFLRTLVTAAFAGLFAVIVHLPALLTSPVSGRSSGLFNTGLLTVDLTDLAAAASAVAFPTMRYFFEGGPNAPIFYIAWFLPLLAFVRWSRLVGLLRQRISVVIVLGVAAFAVLLPSDVGPLRFPVRLMPYLALCVLVIFAIAMSSARLEVVTRRRYLAASAFYALSVWFAFTQAPQFRNVYLAITALGLVGIWVLYRMFSERGLPVLGGVRGGPLQGHVTVIASIGIVAVGLVLLVPQHSTHRQAPVREYGVPTKIADYRTQLTTAVDGDILVVGGPGVGDESTFPWSESVVSNLWYVTRKPVQNAYTSVFYAPYAETTCMAYNGVTCTGLYEELFDRQPDTGKPLVDLLSVSSVQIVKIGVPERVWKPVPEGWRIAEDTDDTRLIVRESPVDGSGGVVWASHGTRIEMLHNDAMGASFRVEEIGDAGGRVALSRITWPGYRVDGATIADERAEDFLMTLELDEGSEGRVVTVSYWAPGWQVQVAAGVGILLLAGVWVLFTRRGRRRRAEPDRVPFGRMDALAVAAVSRDGDGLGAGAPRTDASELEPAPR
ncbi:MAG: Integral rane protein [Agromyces sp.]|nr:Integral rane protein [Agromyces sp.]